MKVEPGLNIAAFARQHRVRFVRKDRSRLMRFLGWLLGLFGYKRFMEHAWTTIGRTVYYSVTGPGRVDWPGDTYSLDGKNVQDAEVFASVTWSGWADYADRHRPTVEHEFHHILQFERLWHLHSLLYLVFPLPVGLAWYRWRCERVAYLHQIKYYAQEEVGWGCDAARRVERLMKERGLQLNEKAFPPIVIRRYVNTLWRVYGWCWPRAWMRRWFLKKLENDQ